MSSTNSRELRSASASSSGNRASSEIAPVEKHMDAVGTQRLVAARRNLRRRLARVGDERVVRRHPHDRSIQPKRPNPKRSCRRLLEIRDVGLPTSMSAAVPEPSPARFRPAASYGCKPSSTVAVKCSRSRQRVPMTDALSRGSLGLEVRRAAWPLDGPRDARPGVAHAAVFGPDQVPR